MKAIEKNLEKEYDIKYEDEIEQKEKIARQFADASENEKPNHLTRVR